MWRNRFLTDEFDEFRKREVHSIGLSSGEKRVIEERDTTGEHRDAQSFLLLEICEKFFEGHVAADIESIPDPVHVFELLVKLDVDEESTSSLDDAIGEENAMRGIARLTKPFL